MACGCSRAEPAHARSTGSQTALLAAPPQACLRVKLQQQVAGRGAAAKRQLHDAVHPQLLHSLQPARPASPGQASIALLASRCRALQLCRPGTTSSPHGGRAWGVDDWRCIRADTPICAASALRAKPHSPDVLAQLERKVGGGVGLLWHCLRRHARPASSMHALPGPKLARHSVRARRHAPLLVYRAGIHCCTPALSPDHIKHARRRQAGLHVSLPSAGLWVPPPRQCGSERRSQSAAAPCRHPPRCEPASARTSERGWKAEGHGRLGQASGSQQGASRRGADA